MRKAEKDGQEGNRICFGKGLREGKQNARNVKRLQEKTVFKYAFERLEHKSLVNVGSFFVCDIFLSFFLEKIPVSLGKLRGLFGI